jgi:tetratricopeptide (TPR) repeat protein
MVFQGFYFLLMENESIYGIIAPMAKKKPLDETTPVPLKKTAVKSKPALENRSADEMTVPVQTTRKSTRKKTVAPEKTPEVVAETAQAEEETPVRRRRGGWIALGILGMLIIALIGMGVGYYSAIQLRKAEEVNQRLIVATTQYELSLQNISDGKLTLAKKRLEYVIQVYPQFPGVADKLAEVMVELANSGQVNQTTTTIVEPTVVATKDTRGASAIFQTAQQQLASQDWKSLYSSITSLRDLDSTYKPIETDGMYYLALRNVGVNYILSGYLEKGIYLLAVAEQIGPIDAEADNYRQLARMYITGSFYESANPDIAIQYFSQLAQNYPNFSDFNGVTATARYATSLENYGDVLETTFDWCGARDQYSTSLAIVNSQELSDKLAQANEYCANPPETPTPEGTPVQ